MDILDFAAGQMPQKPEPVPQQEILQAPPRRPAPPVVAEPFKSSAPATVDLKDAVQYGDVPDADPEMSAANADFVDKIVKQPWAPQARPPDTVVHMSLDGFDRDVDLYPSRYSFRYACGDLRNVTRLTATALSLPVTAGDVPMAIGTPYILVAFEEFSTVFNEGANSAVRRAFCKFAVERVTGFPGARAFARLVPLGGGTRDFTPPLANLTRLTVSFTLPDGALISSVQDRHRIVNVFLNADAMANWIMRTERPWTTDFQAGDLMRITGANTASDRVNAFLNRPEGHTVVAVGEFQEVLGQFASIVIARPYVQDAATKALVFDEVTQAELQALNPPPADGPERVIMNAKVLNVSMQPSLSMTAVCAPSVRHEASV
jgi:hypothetical protein